MEKEYIKEFDRWNTIKKKIDSSKTAHEFFPKIGEVWMMSLGINIGYEQDGSGDNFSRPALVVKKFNNKIYWIVPLSSIQKKLDFYHNYTDPDKNKVSAILAQMRLISIKRFKRKLYSMDESELSVIISKLCQFLNPQIETPPSAGFLGAIMALCTPILSEKSPLSSKISVLQ
jgi:mRNA interferase MazF